MSRMQVCMDMRRHVKCDQARPFCMKCVKSGRECPGYLDSTSRTLLPSKQARIVSRSHNFSTTDTRLFKIPGYETMLFGQQKDWEAFQSFAFSVESGDTLLIDDASIMTPKFAQSAAETSGVRQICCAVGALGRSFQSMTLEDYISEEYQAALEHYGRGVRAIYRLKSSKTTLPSAILASMLFTTFEFMAGSTVNAAKHHNHAVAMMYQYVDLLIEEQGLPLEELRLSDMDKAMFDSLERHDTSPWIESLSKAGHVKILCPARRFPHGCRHRLSMSKIPDRFNSTQQAFTWWNFVQHMMAHSLHPLKVSGDGVRRVSEATKAAAYNECDDFLHSWRTAFTPLLQHAKEHRITHGSRWSRAMILETMYLETISELHARHKTHANMLPAVKPLYLDLIRSMMQLAREKPLNGPATIGLENSIIRPIGFALVRCQDAEVVQEATAALEAIVGGVNMSWTLVYLLKSRNKTKPMVTLERSWGWVAPECHPETQLPRAYSHHPDSTRYQHVPQNDLDLEWISTNSSLPKVVIYSAGGTILSASNYSRLDNIAYGSGNPPTPEDLIGNITEVLDVAQLAIPFVATGAMRPDTYISPDGRSNFYQAVAAAASPASRNRGGLIAFNDRITSIYYSTKVNTNTPDTFHALEQGNLGAFLASQPYYFFDAAYPTGRPYFDVSNTTELPAVIIVYGHQGFDASLMYAAVQNGVKGLVILGPGAASVSPSARAAAADLFEQGIPTVAVARPVTGSGVPSPIPGALIYSSYVGADQARIMLQLAINARYSLDQIRDLFESPLRNAVYGSPASQKYYYSS
ncbi:hypothetical protein K4K55_011182 [Colletotrichum sp. SAR 10_96]|nr:hypothetical protein K4K55_011182 [Colletotrichum sp. SAR 10_96]